MEQLQAYQQRAATLHVTCDELHRVAAALDAAAAWQADLQRARSAHSGALPRDAVQSLLDAAAPLPVYLPAAEGLAVALEQAAQWDVLAAKALAADAPVAKLQELVSAAQAMPVAVDSAQLTEALQGRQWQESAAKALAGPMTSEQMRSLVEQAAAQGAGDSAAAQQLRWHANRCSRCIHHYYTHRARLRGAEALAHRAADLARRWETAASACMTDMRAVAAEAVGLQVAEQPTLEQLRAQVAATTAALRSATGTVQAAQGSRGGPPSHAALQQAAMVAARMPVELQHVDALHARLQAAEAWVGRVTDAADATSFGTAAARLEVR